MLVNFLRWIWEFPQCILGIILIKWYRAEYKETFRETPIYTSNDFPGGISLGQYIIMNESSRKYNRNSIKEHEWGHTRQSIRLGWLYLPTVGLVSSGWCVLREIFPKLKAKDYYSIWPENQADKYGGVQR